MAESHNRDQHRGVIAFTHLIHEYYSAIHDDSLPWAAVIRKLAYVVVFIRHWNRWILEKKHPQTKRLTAQTCLHIEISVHGMVNLIGMWQEHPSKFSSLPPVLRFFVSYVVRCTATVCRAHVDLRCFAGLRVL